MSNKNKIDLNAAMIKEIDLVQACINRMSQNSFYLKGWMITLLGILLALKPSNIVLVNFALILITVAIWYLDSSYLRYEKQYRELYKWVITERVKGNIENLYDLDIKRFDKKVDGRIKIMFSGVLAIFYGVIFTVLIITFLVFSWNSYKDIIITNLSYFKLGLKELYFLNVTSNVFIIFFMIELKKSIERKTLN
ncbi:hypothetical protein P6O24_00520 [Clostridium perfringens]|uniref:hypothetical protein n=1 Tax=Clostridium perfringens TaxID=1502 RepID=UPI001ABABD4E|nr:hypothetical protein [Clostridium perfringens]MBO3376875.1 hypothetical protein [Clostridium perfringens]MDK0557580.1 hypothetical protein [Clostridium perfringens]MDM0689823.1 hypothetical protein [Clostridium perfringens]